MKHVIVSMLIGMAALLLSGTAAAEGKYEGIKACGGCHKSQKESWLKTSHAKVFDSLKPNAKAAEKKKAKLDPAKDYTQDKDCIGCHTIGYGHNGGYQSGMSESKAQNLKGVGCEDCHGAGAYYRKEHRKAGDTFKKKKKSTPRQKLVSKGQSFDYEQACATCHLNYEGSPWKEAKAPFTPFTPKVDAKYKFEFDKAVRDKKALHEHFRLKGVFEGDPVPPIRAEFQKTAQEPATGEDEKE